MTCPDLMTCSMYADSALPEEQARAVARHLGECAGCRARVEALTGEGRALRTAMHAAEATGEIPEFVPRPGVARPLAWLGWAAVMLWAMNVGWMSMSPGAAIPDWLGWLAPDATGVVVGYLVSVMLAFAGAGAMPGIDLLPVATAATAAAAGAGGFWLLLRRRQGNGAQLGATLALAALLGMLAPPGHALELRRDEDRITIPAGETVDDTLIVMAENVLVEGTVTGDLIALGEQVTVRGRVGGTLVAAAETLSVEGQVDGNVLGAAESVAFRGASAGGNLYTAGRTVTLLTGTTVAGNAALAARDAEIHGSVGIDLLAAAERVTLFGRVGSDLKVAGQQVELASSARIGGGLTAHVRSEDDLEVAPGAVVEGARQVETWPEREDESSFFGETLGEVLKLLAAFVTGLVLFYLFPGLGRTRLDSGAAMAAVAGFGALTLVAVPALAVAAMVTLVGAPLGLVTLVAWLVGLYLSGIVAARALGGAILSEEAHHRALVLLLGLAILFVLVNVPFLGGLVRLVAVVAGLGLFVQWLRQAWASRQP